MSIWFYISIISLIANSLLIWYIRELIKKFWLGSSSRKNFLNEIESFRKHLKSIYEMEMFYGDETLQGLVEHSKHITETIEEYIEFTSLFEEEDNLDRKTEEEAE